MPVLCTNGDCIDRDIGNQLQWKVGVGECLADPDKEAVAVMVTGHGRIHFKHFAKAEMSQTESSAWCLDVGCNDFFRNDASHGG